MPNPYPAIIPFLTKLHDRHPRHGLDQYIYEMDLQNFYHIDEIARLSAKGLVGDTFKMSVGIAVFLINEIEKELKRVDRANGKTKCPRLGNWSES
jgi:hypothetical protein